jgi:hypothetical protein
VTDNRLEQRLDRIETQNRFLKVASIVSFVLLAATWLSPNTVFTQSPEVITRRLVLQDAEGRDRAVLETINDELHDVRFRLMDVNGSDRAVLELRDGFGGESDLAFFSPDGHVDAEMGVFAGDAGLNFEYRDENQTRIAYIDVGGKNLDTLMFGLAKTAPQRSVPILRATMAVWPSDDKDSTVIRLRDRDGKEVFVAPKGVRSPNLPIRPTRHR